MATFAFIHGAGDVGWYWHLVEAELRTRDHVTVAPDLPIEDDLAGLAEYAATVVDAILDPRDLVVVAQSFGGYVALVGADQCPADRPRGRDDPSRGDSRGDVHEHPMGASRSDFHTHGLLPRCPRRLADEGHEPGRGAILDTWAGPMATASLARIPTRFNALPRDDRFFPEQRLRTVIRDRRDQDERVQAGCPALRHPHELLRLLDGYLTEITAAGGRSLARLSRPSAAASVIGSGRTEIRRGT